jgi:hypothetical protein
LDGESTRWDAGLQQEIAALRRRRRQRPSGTAAPTVREQPSQQTLAVPEERPRVVLRGRDESPLVLGKEKPPLTERQYNVIKALLDAGKHGLSKDKLDERSGHNEARKALRALRDSDADWAAVIHMPGKAGRGGYRIK